MIRVNVIQGTAEWKQARIGIPTASRMEKLITAKTRKPSAQASDYMHELLCERIWQQPYESASSQFMERGNRIEPQARAWYSFERNVDVEEVGFVKLDDGRAGCSPDGLVGSDGMIQIKAFEAKHHIGALLAEDVTEYYVQQQAEMWIAEREWSDLVLFNPVLPSRILRVARDETFIATLAEIVFQFCEHLDDAAAQLRAIGVAFAADIQTGHP